MNFAAPQFLPLAAAAPIAGALALWILARRVRAERAWVARALEPRLRVGGARRPAAVTALLLALALLGLVLALARPRWGLSSETVQREGLDLVFVIDSSLSMSAADVTPSRYWLAQSIVRRTVAALPGHRVALLAAEGEGEVLAPLTVDAAVVDLVLDGLAPGSLPLPGTRLADAIDRAIDLFPTGREKHRAIVVLSDGEDHGGDLDRAVGAAREAGARIFSIGTATAAGAPIPMNDGSGGFKRDRRGEIVVTRLNREILLQLAEGTGGDYFEADAAGFDIGPLVNAIDALGGRKIESTSVNALEERFQWPLALAVAALGVGLIVGPYSSSRRRGPA
jgi:Ca-activated chloride channel family protein